MSLGSPAATTFQKCKTVIPVTQLGDDRHILPSPHGDSLLSERTIVRPEEQVPPNGSVRILVTDDHAAVRDGVRALLSTNSLWHVCGEAENGKEAVEKVRQLRPDLVVLDVSMPVMNGVDAAREIRRIAPATKIVILSMYEVPQIEVAARQAGADAIVRKSEAGTSLIAAVERLVDGHARH